MEPNANPNPAPNPTPAPEAPGVGGNTPPTTPPQPSTGANPSVVKNQEQGGGGRDMKKMAVVGLLVAIVLVILAVVGYYAYTAMSGSNEEPVATITQPPTPTLEPTVPANPIENEEDLNEVIDEIDSATDEAQMSEEVQGLQSDSNF